MANFFIDGLEAYVRQLNGGHDPSSMPEASRISLAAPDGASLQRYVDFVWGELRCGGGVLRSDFVAQEIEDGLISAFVWTLLQQDSARDAKDKAGWADRRISRAVIQGTSQTRTINEYISNYLFVSV